MEDPVQRWIGEVETTILEIQDVSGWLESEQEDDDWRRRGAVGNSWPDPSKGWFKP